MKIIDAAGISGMALAAALAGIPFAVSPVSAACAPAAANGVTVTCTGNDITGVGTGLQNNVTVNILGGAAITLGNGGADIQLNNNNKITNGGSMTAGDNGAGLSAVGGNTFINNGTVTIGNATGALAAGVFAASNNIVTNNGTFTVGNAQGGFSQAFGIDLASTNTISNNGTLSVGSATGVNGFVFAIDIKDSNVVTNAGSIAAGDAGTPASGAAGIAAGSSNTITNSSGGTIVVGSATALNSSVTALGVNGSNTITNNGIIAAGNALGASSSAVALGAGDNNMITNTGTIRVGNASAGIFRAAAVSIDQNNTVNNSGIIRAGANAFSLFMFSNNTIINTGTFDGKIGTQFGSNDIFANAGVVTITNPGTPLAINNYVIVGTFGQTSGGTLGARVNPAGAHDSLGVTGTAILGGTIGAVVQPGVYANSTVYFRVVTATNTIATTFSQAKAFAAGTTTPLAFFNVTPAYHANSVDLTLTRVSFNALPGLARNQIALANALETSYSPDAAGNAATLFSNLLQATSASTFDALSGEGTSGTQNTAFLAGNMFMQTLTQQADAWRNGDRAGVPAVQAIPYASEPASKNPLYAADLKAPMYKAPPAYVPTWHAWASAFGGTQTVRGDVTGLGTADLSDRTAGGALGLDYAVAPDLLIGLGVAGSSSSFTVADRATSGQLDGAHVGLYGMKTWDSVYVSALLGYSHFNNSTTRTIAGVGPTETANGAFGSDQLGGRLEVGKTLEVGKNWGFGALRVTPFAAVQVMQLWQRGYSENSTIVGDGPGILGLTYASTTTTSLPTFLGAQLDSRMLLANGMAVSPYLRAAWVHEFMPSRTITPTFLTIPGATFTVDGARAASDAAKVDVGARLVLDRNTSLVAAFNGEFSNVGQVYAGTGGLRVTW